MFSNTHSLIGGPLDMNDLTINKPWLSIKKRDLFNIVYIYRNIAGTYTKKHPILDIDPLGTFSKISLLIQKVLPLHTTHAL